MDTNDFVSRPPSGVTVTEAERTLYRIQGGMCFLCQRSINLEADAVEVDHIRPRADKGIDEELNLALLHKECNQRKRASNLELARILLKFDMLRAEHGGALTTQEILSSVGGSAQDVFCVLEPSKVVIRWQSHERHFEVSTDPGDAKWQSFFGTLPIDVLHHDAELNPRKIVDIDKLIQEFWSKNPQLHVALCRLHVDGDRGNCRVLLFDGQHKVAAQVLLGRREIPVRVFVNPNKDQLKEVNRRAHKELRQIEFFRSVLDTLGEDIFGTHFKSFLESAASIKSEKAYIESVDAGQRGEAKRNLTHFLKASVRDCTEPRNRFFDYVEMNTPRSRVWPLSYDAVEKSFFKHFLDTDPCEIPVDIDEDVGTYPRHLERENLVTLMNLVAEEILEGKFSKDMGVYKLEDRLRKQSEQIPDDHLRACRIFRSAALLVWSEFLAEAIAMYLSARGKITNEMRKRNRIFWTTLDDNDWEVIGRMLRRIAAHKIWIDRGPVISDALTQTRPDYFRRLFEQGMIEGIGRVLQTPLNVAYLFAAVGG